jgi:outer membrane protein
VAVAAQPPTPAPTTTPVATGAPAAARRITFDEAIAIAIQQNNTLRQAQNATQLGATNVQQQKLAFLPDLRATTSTGQDYGRNFSQSEGSIVNQTTQSVSAGVSSSLTLFNGLKNVASLREAQLSQNASNQDLARTKQTVAFTVASNFLSLVSAQEQLRVQEQNLTAQETLEQQIQKFVDVGTRPISDLYQQQASTAAVRAAIVDARNAVELAKVDLIQTLQLDPSGAYDFVAPTVNEAAAASASYALDSLIAEAYAQRVDIDAQESRVNAAEQGVKAANASKWPTVSLSLGYNSNYSSATESAFLDQLNQRRGGSIGIGISIPLFDRGVTQLEAERSQIQADNEKLALQNQRQQVALEVRRAYLDYQAARERLVAARAQEKAAQLAVQTTEQRYRVGAATLVELTQARTAQVQAASAMVSARYTLVFRQTLMSYYTGSLQPGQVSLG